MATIIVGSVAFSVGGAFMGRSAGFTRLWPSLIVAACFVIGAGFLARAVHRGGLSTTYVVGLGIEALLSVGIGLALLGERLTGAQVAGLAIILVGLVTVNAAEHRQSSRMGGCCHSMRCCRIWSSW